MTEETMYGWSNYETWKLYADVLQNVTLRDLGYREGDRFTSTQIELLTSTLELYSHDLLETDVEWGSFAMTVLHSFLARVNYEEIVMDKVRTHTPEDLT